MIDPTKLSDLRAALRQRRWLKRAALLLLLLDLALVFWWLTWNDRLPFLVS